jgi:hypothetical protein
MHLIIHGQCLTKGLGIRAYSLESAHRRRNAVIKGKKVLNLLVFTAILVVVVVVGVTSVTASTKYGFSLPISPDKVGEFALEYTHRKMHILSGSPKVVYVQPVTGDILPGLGIPEIKSMHPLMLVIVKGDIDISGAWPRSIQGSSQYNYINYVFDLEEGEPVAILAELDNVVLRRLLNPSERITDVPEPPDPLSQPLPEGTLEPTVVPNP